MDPRPEGPYRAFEIFPTFSGFPQHVQDFVHILMVVQTFSGFSKHVQDFPNMFRTFPLVFRIFLTFS